LVRLLRARRYGFSSEILFSDASNSSRICTQALGPSKHTRFQSTCQNSIT
jgi:hypothetical protein